jgi:RNA polymerase sigma factor (sigma-70 family)
MRRGVCVVVSRTHCGRPSGSGILAAPPVLTIPPQAIVAILKSAQTDVPDPRLETVLQAFRREWMSLGRRRYPSLGDALEDALQIAMLKVISPAKLEGLQDLARVEAWARSIFIHAVMDVVRDLRRHRGHRIPAGPDEDPEDVLRDRLPSLGPTPEEQTSERERLAIVSRCIERLEVARLRFVEDLPERDIAERLDLSRDGVAGQLKRIRKAIRNALEDPE